MRHQDYVSQKQVKEALGVSFRMARELTDRLMREGVLSERSSNRGPVDSSELFTQYHLQHAHSHALARSCVCVVELHYAGRQGGDKEREDGSAVPRRAAAFRAEPHAQVEADRCLSRRLRITTQRAGVIAFFCGRRCESIFCRQGRNSFRGTGTFR